MGLGALDEEIRHPFSGARDPGPNSGIARQEGALQQRRVVAANGFVEAPDMARVETTVDRLGPSTSGPTRAWLPRSKGYVHA
jgi:hypothetical protein